MKEKIIEILNDTMSCDPHTGSMAGKIDAAEEISQLSCDKVAMCMKIISDIFASKINGRVGDIFKELGFTDEQIQKSLEKLK